MQLGPQSLTLTLHPLRQGGPGVKCAPGADTALPVAQRQFLPVPRIEALPVAKLGGFRVQNGAVEIEQDGLKLSEAGCRGHGRIMGQVADSKWSVADG